VRWNIALLSVRTEEDEEEEAQIMILDSSVFLSKSRRNYETTRFSHRLTFPAVN
jgi:hypothetical protein